jgi:hypothetical protein
MKVVRGDRIARVVLLTERNLDGIEGVLFAIADCLSTEAEYATFFHHAESVREPLPRQRSRLNSVP